MGGDIYKDCIAKDTDVLTLACFPILIKQLINIGFMLGGTTALIFIIISGYKLVRSGGDPEATAGARKTLTYAIIGLVIILLSAAIVNLVGNLTNVHCITTGNCS